MISVAVQKGNTVYVYDEKNRILMTMVGTLHGYTGGSVTIKKGVTLYTYNDKKRLISTNVAR